jgi:hypothetical protein
MKNQILVCKQCGSEFELTAQQERTYAERGFDLPERCADCRKKKTREPALSGRTKHPGKKKHYRIKYMVSP